MISLVICSRSPVYLRELIENIEATIGIPYELLAIDNRPNPKGIAEVYNEAAGKAQHEIICFLHEDILIHTIGWGKVLTETLAEESIGLVGISGAVYKSKYPATWSACDSNFYRTHSIQHFKNKEKAVVSNNNPLNKKLAEVVVIDGVFMATTKKIFKQFQFDEKLLPGFHGYDLDYSLQVGTHYKVVVNYEILLEHFSEGNLSQAWLKDSIAVHHKFKNILPCSLPGINKFLIKKSDFHSLQCVLNIAFESKGNAKLILNHYFKMNTLYFSFAKFAYSRKLITYMLKNLLPIL